MAKIESTYVCQQCGLTQAKWSGKCLGCEGWNTLVEEKVTTSSFIKSATKARRSSSIQFENLTDIAAEMPRLWTHIPEFDRVCGGGIVPGSVLLVGGDPGIGKSTLMLQVATSLSQDRPCCYISGEEAVEQVRARARRLGVSDSRLKLASATQVQDIVAALESKGTSCCH